MKRFRDFSHYLSTVVCGVVKLNFPITSLGIISKSRYHDINCQPHITTISLDSLRLQYHVDAMQVDGLDACRAAADCTVRAKGSRVGKYSICVPHSLFHAADGKSVCVLALLPDRFPRPHHCHTVTAAVSATIVKSQLAHFPRHPSDLPLTPTCLHPRSTILRYRDTNCYDNRYGFFPMI